MNKFFPSVCAKFDELDSAAFRRMSERVNTNVYTIRPNKQYVQLVQIEEED